MAVNANFRDIPIYAPTMSNQELQNRIDTYLADTASDKQKQELEAWYQSFDTQPGITDKLSPQLREALEDRMLAKMNARIDAAEPIERERRLWQPAFWLRVAASIAFLLVFSWVSYQFYQKSDQRTPVAYTEVRTPKGKVQKVTLPDGSEVWLNAASKIRYSSDFGGEKREVWLEGEAYFSVVHQTDRPFQVHTGNLLTNVLGTVFNVEAYPDGKQIAVTVSSGKVGVMSPTHEDQFLTPNQQVIYDKAKADMTRRTVDASLIGAWTNGQLAFRTMSFEQIASRLERQYNVKILFANDSLKNCLLSARFDAKTPLKEVLNMLCQINGNTFTQEAGSDTLRIRGKGCN